MGLFPSNFVTADLTVEPEMSKYFLVCHWTVILYSLKFSFLEQEFSNLGASRMFIKNAVPQSVYQAVDFYLGKEKVCLCICMSLQKCRSRSVVEFNLVFLVSSVDNSVTNVV